MREAAILRMNAIEMVYLARLMRLNYLKGMMDPFYGKLAEDVREEFSAACTSLQEKGILRLRSDGKYSIDILAATVVNMCAKAETTYFIYEKDHMNAEKIRVVHLRPSILIEYPFKKRSEEDIDITLSVGVSSIKGFVDFFKESNKTAVEEDLSISLSLPAFNEIMGYLRNQEAKAGERLADIGIDQSIASRLAGYYGEPVEIKGIIAIYYSNTGFRIQGLGFIESGEHILMITPAFEGKDAQIEMCICTRNEANRAISNLVDETTPIAG